MVSVQATDIINILKGVVSAMVITVKVNSVVDNGDGTFTIQSCNTQYLRECSIFSVAGNTYVVDSFVQDVQLVISGSPVLTTDFVIPPPLLIVGTPTAASQEMKQIEGDGLDQYPFIWVLETFIQPYNNDGLSAIVSEPAMKLFFFDSSKDESWLNADHRTNVVLPMKSLIDQFNIQLDATKGIGDFNQFAILDRVEFGKYEQNKGYTSSILGGDLSGVEINITIPLLANSCLNLKC